MKRTAIENNSFRRRVTLPLLFCHLAIAHVHLQYVLDEWLKVNCLIKILTEEHRLYSWNLNLQSFLGGRFVRENLE